MSYKQRAAQYERARPSYSQEAINCIIEESPRGATVADIGAGTGILTKLLSGYFPVLYGIEPDEGMRRVLKETTLAMGNIIPVGGSAEHTTLNDNSVDVVCIAQALHWFDINTFHTELARIMKPGGKVFIIHNTPPVITFDVSLNKNENKTSINALLASRKKDRINFFEEKLLYREFSNSIAYDKERFIDYFMSLSTGPEMNDENQVKQLIEKIGKKFDEISEKKLVTLHFTTELYTTKDSYK